LSRGAKIFPFRVKITPHLHIVNAKNPLFIGLFALAFPVLKTNQSAVVIGATEATRGTAKEKKAKNGEAYEKHEKAGHHSPDHSRSLLPRVRSGHSAPKSSAPSQPNARFPFHEGKIRGLGGPP
jgi:hypothetical protein